MAIDIWRKRLSSYQLEERGKIAVNLKKESINLPWLFSQPLPVNKRTLSSLNILLPLPSFSFFKDIGWVNNHGRLIVSFFKLTTSFPLEMYC